MAKTSHGDIDMLVDEQMKMMAGGGSEVSQPQQKAHARLGMTESWSFDFDDDDDSDNIHAKIESQRQTLERIRVKDETEQLNTPGSRVTKILGKSAVMSRSRRKAAAEVDGVLIIEEECNGDKDETLRIDSGRPLMPVNGDTSFQPKLSHGGIGRFGSGGITSGEENGGYKDNEEDNEEGASVSSDQSFTTQEGEKFIKHRVRNHETLAGLAVKYKVSVSDIMRSNGLQTDTAMFGKEYVLIPRKPFSIGPEHAAWAGMIIAHYEQHPFGSSAASGSSALDALRGYYSTDHSPVRRMHGIDHGGMSGHFVMDNSTNKKDDDMFTTSGSCGFREVELMARTDDSISAIPSSYIEERLHRRRRNDEADIYGDDMPLHPQNGSEAYDEAEVSARYIFDAMRDRDIARKAPILNASTSATMKAWKDKSASLSREAFKELKELHSKSVKWKDQIFNKLKKVASQPALSTVHGTPRSRVGNHSRAMSTQIGVGKQPSYGVKKD